MSTGGANGDGTAAAQRKDGTWYRTIVIDGKRRYVYGRNQTEVIARNIKRMTVEEYMTNWLTLYKKVDLRPKSYDTIEATLIYQIAPFFKGRQFFSLTHDEVQKFINTLDSQGCSYSVIRKAYLALNACCKFAMLRDGLQRNPCEMARLPKKADRHVKTIQTLTAEQIKAYCDHATERYSNGDYIYIGVGVTYEGCRWYCDVAMSKTNHGYLHNGKRAWKEILRAERNDPAFSLSMTHKKEKKVLKNLFQGFLLSLYLSLPIKRG